MRLALPLLAALALTGCDAFQSGPSAELTTARTVYAPGETVEVQVENRSPRRLYYGGCVLTIERQEDGRWVDAAPDRYCTMILYGLGPGQTVTERHTLRDDLSAGPYRVAFYFDRGDNRPSDDELATATIRVEP